MINLQVSKMTGSKELEGGTFLSFMDFNGRCQCFTNSLPIGLALGKGSENWQYDFIGQALCMM